jgi:hypothetical protein
VAKSPGPTKVSDTRMNFHTDPWGSDDGLQRAVTHPDSAWQGGIHAKQDRVIQPVTNSDYVRLIESDTI